VWIERLRLNNLRRFEDLDLLLGPGVNLLLGPNGSGKTTILEAAYLLSHGHSFRAGGRDALVRHGATGYQVFTQLHRDSGQSSRLGLERQHGVWAARINDKSVSRLSALFAGCAVCCFEPGSHELIDGSPDGRRAFLDWGVFHVEPEFLPLWRRYQRALRQRNALLRAGAAESAFDPWDLELARSGELITEMRTRHAEALEARFIARARQFLPELGAASLEFKAGWDQEDGEGRLLDQLRNRLARDRIRQNTSRGPHRADWQVRFEHAPHRDHLSRGQTKLTAIAAVLAQAELYRELCGEWPIIGLDDLPSELDYAHQARVITALAESGAQLLITGTEASPPLLALSGAQRFHVEHGQVQSLVD
jgi:DNA replication and repair protein RecF